MSGIDGLLSQHPDREPLAIEELREKTAEAYEVKEGAIRRHEAIAARLRRAVKKRSMIDAKEKRRMTR